MRFACVRLRDAALAAMVRREPALLDAPAIVLDAAGAHGRVIARSPAAARAGVAHGLTAAAARAVVPELMVRVLDRGALEAARAALADAAASVAPRVEPDGDRVYLDAGEVRSLYNSDQGLCAAVTEAARRLGLDVDVGVASNKGTARVAASRRVGGVVVPEGRERAFLAPWPLDVLPLDSGLRVELARLGVRYVGELAALPLEATGTRLGAGAARAIALGRGEDPSPLFPRPHATRFEERAELEWEVRDAGALLFVIKRLCDALCARLACRGLAAARVVLALVLAQRATDERTIDLAVASRDPAMLLHLLRASIDGAPPPDGVVGARLAALASPPRPVQLGLFEPPAPAPERMALLLARLAALVGQERVGAPAVPDSHRPHAVALEPFDARVPAPRATAPRATHAVALHVLRPPRPAHVTLEHGRMVHVQAGDIAGPVRTCCGPFRVAGEWWNEAFDHEGFDVELGDGGLYLVAFDRLGRCWRVEGVYD